MRSTVQVPTEKIQENNSFQGDELTLKSCHSFPSLHVLGMTVLNELGYLFCDVISEFIQNPFKKAMLRQG